MSLRARLLNQWLRKVEKTAMARAEKPQTLRKRFETEARFLFHGPRGTQMQWQVLDAGTHQIDALEIVPPIVSGQGVLLYIHGGGFVFGSPRTHSAMIAQLAARVQLRAVLPQYRLAPEAQFPAAAQDVRAAWDALCASGIAPADIVVGGDSAGGALALGLLAELCAEGADMPAGVFCFSPLTDLTFSGDSFVENEAAEAVLPASRAGYMTSLYVGDQPRDDPKVSPLFADFTNAAPVWLTVGDAEILRDDTLRMGEKLALDGVDVTVIKEHDLPHVWTLFHNILPEARHTLDILADWIRQRSGSQAES